MECGGKHYEVVDNFTYLGSCITNTNEELKEVQKRITAANRTFFSLISIFKARNVHRECKIKLYKSIIRTVVCYGSEAWTITARTADLLNLFERRMLRRIYGPVCEAGQWRIRTNAELATLYREPPLSAHIRLMRLRWAGHLQRMPDVRVPRKVFVGQPGGRRPVGRPRERWEDRVAKDAREMLRMRRWKGAAMDRDGWRQSLIEAKARLGL